MLRRPAAILALALMIAAVPRGAGAQAVESEVVESGTVESGATDPRAAVERLFGGEPIERDWFAPAFLAEIPAAEVERMVEDMTRRFGPLREIAAGADGLTVRLEGAEVPTRATLDRAGRIAGLVFEAPIPTGSLDELVAAIAALPGRSSVLVLSDGETRAAHEPAAVLAVGSAAKLAVAKAVGDAVAAGRLAWDEVVPFDPGWRSLPSGILQDWPEGTPLTVATLASLAISISDNTATDALIDLVGRAAVEAVTPRNAPFLSTRALFVLKASGNDALRRAWREGDAAARRALLDRIDGTPLPAPGDLDPAVSAEIEWFLSAKELCALLADTAELPALHINPGPARPEAWRSIAFKGGSEPGVLNLSTRLVAGDGTTHCVVATWNDDDALDQAALAGPYRGILRSLAGS